LQFKVAVFRSYPPKGVKLDHWAPHLRAIEKVVERELALFQKHKGDLAELLRQMNALDKEGERLFQRAMEAEAKRRGVILAGPLCESASKWTVKVKTEPPAAIVCFLRRCEFEALEVARGLEKLQNWHAVSEGTCGDVRTGHYIFRAHWGHTFKTTPTVSVANDITIRINRDD
jgi:hypothetical protein